MNVCLSVYKYVHLFTFISVCQCICGCAYTVDIVYMSKVYIYCGYRYTCQCTCEYTFMSVSEQVCELCHLSVNLYMGDHMSLCQCMSLRMCEHVCEFVLVPYGCVSSSLIMVCICVYV